MKNKVLKTVLSLVVLMGFAISSPAQVQKNCNTTQPEIQKMCYEQIVSTLGNFIEYPEEAYFNDNEGKVVVKFKTDRNNKITKVSIVEASNRVLAKSVLDAVELMAANADNSYLAADKTYSIPVNFNLKD